MDTRSKQDESPKINSWPSTAWLIVWLLVPVAVLNYMDRQMLAAMRASVIADVSGIRTDEDWGFILACFKWTYAFFCPLGGYIADRVGRKWLIIGSLVVWSIVTWMTSQVETYQQLLWTRALMGISEAFYIPAALALIADYHLGSTRARAIGFHQMGIYIGVILGGFTGYVADAPDFGWRWVFSASGILGVVYAVPLFFLLKEPTGIRDQKAGGSSTSHGESVFASLIQLLGNVSFLLMLLYFTLPALGGWIVRDWMPSILKEFFHISQGLAGVTATLSYQLPAIGGAIAGGWLADRWVQSDQRGRIYLSAIGVGLIVPALMGMGISPATGSLGFAVLTLAVFGIGWGFFDCNNMPILCQIVQPRHRATAYGLMNLVSISFGGVADWGLGAMRHQGYSLLTIFGIFCFLALLAIPIVLAVRPTISDSK